MLMVFMVLPTEIRMGVKAVPRMIMMGAVVALVMFAAAIAGVLRRSGELHDLMYSMTMLATKIEERTAQTDRRLQQHGESSQEQDAATHSKTVPLNVCAGNTQGITRSRIASTSTQMLGELIHRTLGVHPSPVLSGSEPLIDERGETLAGTLDEFGGERGEFLGREILIQPLLQQPPMLGFFQQTQTVPHHLAGGAIPPRLDLRADEPLLRGGEGDIHGLAIGHAGSIDPILWCVNIRHNNRLRWAPSGHGMGDSRVLGGAGG